VHHLLDTELRNSYPLLRCAALCSATCGPLDLLVIRVSVDPKMIHVSCCTILRSRGTELQSSSGAFVRTRSRQQSDSGFSKSRRVSFLEAYLESSREASGEGGGNRMIVRGDEEKVV
jgi:hypothetical protein